MWQKTLGSRFNFFISLYRPERFHFFTTLYLSKNICRVFEVKWLVTNYEFVDKQKSESQNGCLKKKARQIFRKTNISYPLIRTCQKFSFFGKFDVLSFLGTLVLRFALLPYYLRIASCYLKKKITSCELLFTSCSFIRLNLLLA